MIADIADPHQIQRLRFTPGQDLLARDFRDGETFEARLRHWHNRAIHQAYGVSSGLGVEPISFEIGVEVSPGLAYDAIGRELALTATRIVPFPLFQGPHLLVLRHGGELLWVPEIRLQPCDSVPLARIVSDRGEIFDPDFRPPVARPLARPRIGYGSTAPGGTSWQAEALTTYPVVLLHLEIDTRSTGFTRLPCYFVSLEGNLPFQPVHLSLENATSTSFRVRLLVRTPSDPSLVAFDPRQIVLNEARQTISISWLGIQMDHDPTSAFEVHNGNS